MSALMRPGLSGTIFGLGFGSSRDRFLAFPAFGLVLVSACLLGLPGGRGCVSEGCQQVVGKERLGPGEDFFKAKAACLAFCLGPIFSGGVGGALPLFSSHLHLSCGRRGGSRKVRATGGVVPMCPI